MKILLVAWFDPNGTSAIVEHLVSIQNLSANDVEIFNTFQKRKTFFKKNILKYDVLIFHNTVSYNPFYLKTLSSFFFPDINLFGGVKVLMKQDEMKLINETKLIIDEWGINVLTSCLDSENILKVYGSKILNKITYINTLTGYVTPEFRNHVRVPLASRSLDVVYRGMETPFEWGRLGYEKFYIGEEFNCRAKSFNLKTDISSRNTDRIYGAKWFEFLSSSRATLAVESGASIFDFDGSIEKWCKRFKEENPNAQFEDAYSIYLKHHDGKIKYNQISPRHIEAAALGTVQIMFEGEYSNIFFPDKHYIPLKKDFSNMDEVVKKLKDNEFCNKLIVASINDILSRDDLTFDFFVKKLDEGIWVARSKM